MFQESAGQNAFFVGLGSSHQTGWAGVIARSMHLFATSSAEQLLELGKAATITEIEK